MGQRARIIAIANQKGGVGKTTTAINLSAALAAAEKRVLLVDSDAQANASSGVGLSIKGEQDQVDRERRNLYRALIGEAKPQEVIYSTALEYLKVIPAHTDLVGIEVEMIHAVGRERLLEEILREVSEQFDYIIIDCPPSLGLVTLNALTAADSVIIPLQCEYFAMEGLSGLAQTIELVRANFNPRLRIEGVLLTMFDPRNRLAREVADEVRKHFPGRVFAAIIPRNVRLGEAPSFGKPVILYDIECKGSEGYLKLANELMHDHVMEEVLKPLTA